VTIGIDAKQLFFRLLHADSQDEVVRILEDVGLWREQSVWRLYGDKEGNFAQAGNQQSQAEAALVEKLVNSVDARLMLQCQILRIDPEGEAAPPTVRAAVAKFFGESAASGERGGALLDWPQSRRNQEARNITVAATGAKPTQRVRRRAPCLTIVDTGEGQEPQRLPNTILSLNAKNKQRVKFVQGKFNMGGSGALRFCGEHGLQLVLSRRHPELSSPDGDSWGFTIVRREAPSGAAGEPIHSEFVYLAPVGAPSAPRAGSVLTFRAPSLPVLPEANRPYSRHLEWGTLIKLYEYQLSVSWGHILRKDGLLYALDRLLPEIALPVRLHECREGYGGDVERSFDTSMAGLVVRLEDGKGDNLEDGFPLTVSLAPSGMNMTARIYAFKEDKAALYLKNEGIIFAVNGQANGSLPKAFFSRPKSVGLQRLRDSLLVLVDCSHLEVVQRENLFMSSRDRLSRGQEREAVERELEEFLRHEPALRRLQERRRLEDVEKALDEEKPLENVLEKVFRSSPTLRTLFLRGQRLSRPFGPGATERSEGAAGTDKGGTTFVGRKHPTYFRFKGLEYGRELRRDCEEGRRVRITFETDVENGYFDRAAEPGHLALEVLEGSDDQLTPSYSLVLDSGQAHLSVALPEGVRVGEQLVLQVVVDDPTLLEGFTNVMRLSVKHRTERKGGAPSTRSAVGKGEEPADTPSAGIAMPHIVSVREGDSAWLTHKFTASTACVVVSDLIEENVEYSFYINLDNDALRTELKYSKQNVQLLEGKFKYGNVLLGLALLEASRKSQKVGGDAERSETDGESEASVEDLIRRLTEAAAPVLIPMIDTLGGLTESDLAEFSEIGDSD